MKNKLYNLALAEIILWSISLIDLIDYGMRGIAFIGAVLTLVMAGIKFLDEKKIRKKQNNLIDLQIEEKVRVLNKLKDDEAKQLPMGD